MQQIKVRIPKASNIRTIIRKTYRDLYDARKAAMPNDSAYTRKQLEQNIKNASAINGKIVTDIGIKNSTFEEWATRGWKQLYHFHWYFAVTLNRTRDGEIIAVVQDAHYEGEHHNDTLTSQPYDESQIRKGKIVINENDIRKMVRECVYRILDESYNGRIGEYECKNGFLRALKAPSLKQFGYFNDVRLYYSPSHTYCLLRREDNGTLFFAEIIDAPEIGKNETKYVPRKPSEVPTIILRDAQSLLRKAKRPHTLLS